MATFGFFLLSSLLSSRIPMWSSILDFLFTQSFSRNLWQPSDKPHSKQPLKFMCFLYLINEQLSASVKSEYPRTYLFLSPCIPNKVLLTLSANSLSNLFYSPWLLFSRNPPGFSAHLPISYFFNNHYHISSQFSRLMCTTQALHSCTNKLTNSRCCLNFPLTSPIFTPIRLRGHFPLLALSLLNTSATLLHQSSHFCDVPATATSSFLIKSLPFKTPALTYSSL